MCSPCLVLLTPCWVSLSLFYLVTHPPLRIRDIRTIAGWVPYHRHAITESRAWKNCLYTRMLAYSLTRNTSGVSTRMANDRTLLCKAERWNISTLRRQDLKKWKNTSSSSRWRWVIWLEPQRIPTWKRLKSLQFKKLPSRMLYTCFRVNESVYNEFCTITLSLSHQIYDVLWRSRCP